VEVFMVFRRSIRHPALLLSVLALAAFTVASGCRQQDERAITYSDFKNHIANGEVREVQFFPNRLEARPTDEARAAGAPERWVALPVAADASLIPLLESRKVSYGGNSDRRILPNAAAILLGGALIAALGFIVWQRARAQGLVGFGGLKVRDAQPKSTTRFQDVAGVDEAREELEEVVSFLRAPERFAAIGARTPRGVLLVGPPGTGKTLLARAVAGEAEVPFFAVSGAEFLEMYVGVGAARVRKLFKKARAQAPAIIFIDELDAIGKSRTGGPTGANDEREHTLNQLLVELDGFDPRSGLVVIAATNRADTLDQALLRPGRFDRQVLVDRPDYEGRAAILQVHSRRVVLEADVDLAGIAKRTPGFVGADLENLLNEAALLAARTGRERVGMAELEAAIDRVVAGLERKRRLSSEHERRLVAYHEAGHALVAEVCPRADRVQKVSIVPRGKAALGFTQQLAEDRYLMQEDELMDRLAVLLGGRAAEVLIFGQFSTGASNDLERATGLARRMVSEFGMSVSLGPMSFPAAEARTAGAEGDTTPPSEQVTSQIEVETQQLLTRAFERACEQLKTSRAALDAIAAALLERGTIDRTELQALLVANGVSLRQPPHQAS
jgi:cell division protease FtsH